MVAVPVCSLVFAIAVPVEAIAATVSTTLVCH
jgi:hypothetical protein